MNLQENNIKVLVVGAGLAGSDAAMFLANKGISVVLIERKTLQLNPAQKLKTYAELVCTNSLKSNSPDSAHGLLKLEMEALGSLVLEKAKIAAVPAGDALAVDREQFSGMITDALKNHPNINVVEQSVTDPLETAKEFGCQYTIVATGPLTSEGLEKWINENISKDDFYFYDAIAPVVDASTLDFTKLYYKDRYKEVSEEEGEQADYLNSPMNKEQYINFITELKNAEKVPSKDFEKYVFFESCLPIDLMAERGEDTARFSCMKPVGLSLEGKDVPYAVVQMRKENLLGSAFNLVGFQTRLTYKEQVRVFRMIPGLEEASFFHLGSVHRNTFLNAKKLLNSDLSSKEFPNLYFAGQITGVEGYTESASMGLYVAWQLYRRILGKEVVDWPVETGMGALVNYIMTSDKPSPSNINFGLLPPVTLNKEQRRDRKGRKKVKKALAAQRAQEVFKKFIVNVEENQQ